MFDILWAPYRITQNNAFLMITTSLYQVIFLKLSKYYEYQKSQIYQYGYKPFYDETHM